MALLDEKSIERKSVQTARGEGTVFTLTPVVFGIRVTGHMEPPVAELIISYVNAGIRRAEGRKVYLFHDWLALEGYDSSCRQRLTTWSSENLKSYAEVHIAQRSKIVAMGVQVANLVLNGLIQTHGELAPFERELRRVLDAEGRQAAPARR